MLPQSLHIESPLPALRKDRPRLPNPVLVDRRARRDISLLLTVLHVASLAADASPVWPGSCWRNPVPGSL